MSRTWRKVPKPAAKPANTSSHPRQGGAGASKGPSPQRRRPDSDYQETLHLAAAMLDGAARRMTLDTTVDLPSNTDQATAQILWLFAADGDCPVELLQPTIDLAQQAVKQVANGEAKIAPSPELLAGAANFLKAMADKGAHHNVPHGCEQTVPDGRQRDSRILFWRDDRVTGLRAADHRRARREARQGLADPESAETVRAGKNRRYTDKHGNYDL